MQGGHKGVTGAPFPTSQQQPIHAEPAKQLNKKGNLDERLTTFTAVAKGDVNKSPPRLGRQGEVPIEEFKNFCSAVFTACAIEQANCKERSNREQLKSVVGEILNTKRMAEGLPEMNDARFYRRIEEEICHLQDLTKADSRESLRVLWLTYKTQLRHYENWEQYAVELGFARELAYDERPNEVGHIV
ncbi:hypothetical protein SEMRO_2361_G324820.1 [Seminavis robusta]|uniref:Uncharacterized protein n=1 Tax=Seminavis robusta TaxID=568900 RepID=A0A9N8F221_9STRA|nr:hypothetical protein SEMRO_2361_G324820.1 [Seminavis robusta]|eukprot:Sro2361_g324820.1 n/a (187) ;mRNA; r:11429-12138